MAGRGKRWIGKANGYYNIPLITKAHWSWEIVLYFFFGGLAGGSFLVSTIASLFGSREDTPVIRVGRYLSFVSILISPLLLIKDLGRPERFLNMLRVLKLRSVLSISTWAISALACSVTSRQRSRQHRMVYWTGSRLVVSPVPASSCRYCCV